MKPDSLLTDVLGGDDAFRAATQRQVLALAGRRRRRRNARRMLAGCAAIGCVVFLFRLATPPPSPGKVGEGMDVAIVRSMPLSENQIAHTRGELFSQVGSSPAGLALVEDRPGGIQITETRLAPLFDTLDDRELLAAFPGRRAALVGAGTGHARLIFY